MKVLVILSAMCAVALAAPGLLATAPLLPKVQVAAPQVTIVKQPYTVHQPELVYRQVPVPIKAVAYTAPAVVPAPVAVAPIVHAPAVAVAHIAAPALAYHAVPSVHVL